MPVDTDALARFYDSPRGQVARRNIQRRLRTHFSTLTGQALLGIGYAAPYLRMFMGEAERVIAAEPAFGAPTPFPYEAKRLSAVVEDLSLPFGDSAFENILIVHGLENADGARRFLREVWRVTVEGGLAVFVVPNRVSFWAQLERTPFGDGQPYSRGQLQHLLEDSLFDIRAWDSALFIPPFGWSAPRLGRGWENLGHRFWPRLSGVHIVAARKTLYAGSPVDAARARRMRLVLASAR